ncbi:MULTISPECIES: cytochrome C oxidase subunit IV family protein [Mycobacterium]|nr:MULTISPECIES: cytochrome C oxidase subunit IV family protein [Mycobacterium]MCV7393816.1 cytochrome C oxidase subunit IV family protein [Mycobacterium paraseoulense]BBZ70565.1 hypothetical protein MPRS_16580 [Mycobacterium paraseoulense]
MPLSLLRARSTPVWLALILVTILSWMLGAKHETGSAIAILVLGLAIVKVRFIGLDFMELREAPLILRVMFEGYCVVLWLVLSGMYLWL